MRPDALYGAYLEGEQAAERDTAIAVERSLLTAGEEEHRR